MLQAVGRIPSVIARGACLFILGGIRMVVPDRMGRCRFTPTCSQYAMEALRSLPVHRAVPLIIWRVLRCNPLCVGGYDPIVGETVERVHK